MTPRGVFFNEMKKTEKSLFVDNLAEELKSATSVVLINYSGLSVKAQQELKKNLKEVDAKLTVVKNTLLKKAGKAAKTPKEIFSDTVLSGPIALVITEDDPIAPLQILDKFAKDNQVPQLKVGIIEGSYLDNEALVKLSKLPSKEALNSQVVGTIGAPLYSLIATLQSNMQQLIYILNTKATN